MGVFVGGMVMMDVVGGFVGVGWGGAAVGGLAFADLELNRRVGDVESLAHGAVDGVEDGG